MTNLEIAELLRRIAAAYEILGENRFKIIAYDRAADSIEHLTQDLKDVWQDGNLANVSGIGKGIAYYLNELFERGSVAHFDDVLSRVPSSVFPLLLVPGIGPKKAYTLVSKLGFTSEKTVVADLEKAIADGKVASLDGFGKRSQDVLGDALETYKRGQIKENRMLLSEADKVAEALRIHLEKNRSVMRVDLLGSLRRRVATVGDIDIAVSTENPGEVIEHFLTFPHRKCIDKGTRGSTILLHNGRQVDLRVQGPATYGSMLQYFTGSKHHNIALRTYALDRGKSLSEHGIRSVRTKTVQRYADEEEFYRDLGLSYIPPELREDMGEIEAARTGKLPDLVSPADIRGDLHVHTSYNFPVSHDLGSSHVCEYLDRAEALGYEYIGFADHNPKITGTTSSEIVSIMKRRYGWYRREFESWKEKTGSSLHMYVLCEVDILTDGRLGLPEEAFEYIDGAVISVHSAFTQEKARITQRLIRALSFHKKVKIFGHPTGRIIGKREAIDASWKDIFALSREKGIALEINAYPDRLDLPDRLVFDAVRDGVSVIINTDAHHVDQLSLVSYGVSVARRGWASRHDIRNTMTYNTFDSWFSS